VVNRKRVERVWRDEGLKAHTRRRAGKKAVGSAENAIWNLPAQHPDHVWALDFIGERLSTGRPYRVLNVIDEYTRRGVASVVDTTIGRAARPAGAGIALSRAGAAGYHPHR
jgi:putative transposase